jgi:tetratricopeptide (TPR) repeat protein
MASNRWRYLSTLAVAGLLLFGCGTGIDVSQTISRAQKYLDAKLPEQAEQILLPALQRIGHDNTAEVDRAKLLVCLGDAYWQARKLADAEASYKEAELIYDRQLGPGSLDVAAPLSGLKNVYEHNGHFAEAEKAARRALSILDKHLQPDDPRLDPAVSAVLSVACRSGKCLDEIGLDERLLSLRVKHEGIDHEYTCAARLVLAEANLHHKNYVEAIKLCKQNVDSERRTNSDNLVGGILNLAHALNVSGNSDEALQLVEEARDIQMKQKQLLFPQQLLGTLHMQGQILYDLGRYKDAEDTDALLIDKGKKLYDANNPLLADFYVSYADALSKTGKSAQSRSMQAEAERLYRLK